MALRFGYFIGGCLKGLVALAVAAGLAHLVDAPFLAVWPVALVLVAGLAEVRHA